MNKDLSYFRAILEKYLNNTCTPLELEELLAFFKENESNKLILEQLNADFKDLSAPLNTNAPYSSRLLENILQQIETPVVPMPARNWRKMIAAVAAVFVIAISIYFFSQPKSPSKNEALSDNKNLPYKNDIVAGGDKAVLILANGESILLDSAANGTLTQQGNTKVIKLNNGELAYTAENATKEILYNSIVTPKGGQYQVTLPDGTKVWLNASSSLRFPTAFVGKERRVDITGEAYFEVEKNPSMPFIVKINGGDEVEVLGTHFNIMAYGDESVMKTTLLEGSINLHASNEIQRLKPGQQALSGSGKMKVIDNADVEQAVAWKNGLFDFDDDKVVDIMRQLSRWYDIEVVYENNKIPEGHYGGAVRRKSNISAVLKMLEFAGDIRFDIQGKKVIVKQINK